MTFEYSAASVNLFSLVFEQIFKINPDLIYNYTAISDQIINLIFLPHIVLFIFLLGFGEAIAHEHRGLKYLVMIASYIFIVTQGWYGSFLIPLTQSWFLISLGIGLFLFFITRIIHPGTATKLAPAIGKLTHDIGKKAGNEKEIEILEDELKHIIKEKRKYEGSMKQNPGAAEVYSRLSAREFELKRAIKKLEK